jgi:uncharacterized protein YdaU (DUF1376 family)
MPVYIGDYLADTMHLSTEQHGAYLLLLFHLWRRGSLQDDDTVLAKITGLTPRAWSGCRAVLAQFFKIEDGLWRHGRVERERNRIAAKQQSISARSRLGAQKRWHPDALPDALPDDASSMAQAMPGDAKSESESELEEIKSFPASVKAREKRVADERHTPFRAILAAYWREKNHAFPEMPWEGRDAKALSDFLAASPQLDSTQFRRMLGNRARSAVAHGDRVYLWIANLTRYQEEITVYNKPVSAGGGHASRAEINRNSVVDAVDRAMDLAREHADRVRQASFEPAALADPGMSFADGAGPGGRALELSGGSDYGMAAGHAAHGQAGADGPLPYRAATAIAGRAAAPGRAAGRPHGLRFDTEVRQW